jgi:hypothetical protein
VQTCQFGIFNNVNIIIINKRVIKCLQIGGNSDNRAEQYKCQGRMFPHAHKKGLQIHFAVRYLGGGVLVIGICSSLQFLMMRFLSA